MVKLKDTSSLLYHYGAKPAIFDRAQLLRKSTTEAERILWNSLRNKNFEGLKFRRQHPINRFIVDFYCHEKKLILEVDGGIHDETAIRERDEGREEELRNYGLQILRFTNEEILNNMNEVMARLKLAIQLAPPRHGKGSLLSWQIWLMPKRCASFGNLPGCPAEVLPSPIGEGSGVRQKAEHIAHKLQPQHCMEVRQKAEQIVNKNRRKNQARAFQSI